MSDETIQAQVTMLHRDVLELRAVDERHDRTLERLRGDTEHLKSQHAQLWEQQMEHGKLLLRHGELHVQHAEQISAARELSREAVQRSSEMAHEWRNAVAAIDKHVANVATSQADAVAKVGEQVGRLATAQEAMNTVREKDREEQALQTVALNTLIDAVKSPIFAVYVAVGGIVGGALVAIAERLLR